MDTRQIRLLGVLAVVLAALAAVLYFGEPPDRTGLKDDKATARVVDALDLAEARALRVEQSRGERDATLRFEKRDGVWYVVEPYEALADLDNIVEMLDGVRESEWGIPVQGPPTEFGLEPPVAVVTVTVSDGSERRLEVGNVAPDRVRTYMTSADGGVAAVLGTPGEALLRRANEYRDHRVFRYSPGEVTRVRVESPGGTLEATRRDGTWWLTGYARVDLDALEGWLIDLQTLSIDLFMDLDVTEPAPGDPVQYRIEIDTPAGTQRAWVGRDTPYGPLLFVSDGRNGPMEPTLLNALRRGPTDVGVAEAFPFDDTVDTVTLSGAREVTLTRAEDGWTGAPDAEAVVAVIAHAQLAYKRDAPVWTGPELTVTLEGQAPTTIDVGPPDAEGFRSVRDRAGGEAIRVRIDEVEALFGAPEP